jgi:hypothetical protein
VRVHGDGVIVDRLVRTKGVADHERLAVGPAGLVELGPPAAFVPDHPLRGGGQRREARDGGDHGQEQHLLGGRHWSLPLRRRPWRAAN